MTQASVFLNNKTQAIRLPKDVALPDGVKTVEVIALGDARLITPADRLWDSFFDGPAVSDDFMETYSQPGMQVRESF
ncbi:type II toxin-antitoxin system VapB family antitoxin [Thalassospira sp.]|uniref:type II toxin-antitoxin system VapB family antitoxin n=1 Tax=Thalassospira sp. TaxID=1912094 RepID=UPI002732AD55|nr:type II toxin-antitoxin system VapB family antitoxin [Thalassospira sp.]MDP2698467.1 type II toxin-antitoxin system VapB family antitoxin [Thalassospira sp.]